MGKKIPIEQRLAERTFWRGGCRIWTGCTGSDGYPLVAIGHGTSFRLSRVLWNRAHGEIAPGLLVCHKCDEPLCVNIDHFFLGTPKENTQDMLAKGRYPVRRGDGHHGTKIADADLSIIKARRSSGEYLKDIAADYGVAFQTISAICRGLRQCAK